MNRITGKDRRNGFFTREGTQAWLMLAPQLLGFVLFTVYPVIWIFRYAWYDFDGAKAIFVGFDNFVRLFTRDPYYWESLVNTFILSFGKLLIELPLALVLAVMLNSKLKGKTIFRTTYFMPNIVSVAIIGLIFYFMFDPFQGIINNLLLELKLISAPINWFGEKWKAMMVIATASIWQNFGINMFFFLSGLQNIPAELYECAEIDGASKWKQFTKITVPMLAPTLQIVTMLAILGSIKMTDLVLVLTNGNPAGQTNVVMTYIFKYFFKYGEGAAIPQIGYAAALGLITAIILGIVTLIYMKLTKGMSNNEG